MDMHIAQNALSVADPEGVPRVPCPFQGEPKNAFDSDRTLKAEKQAACEM